MDVIQMYVEVCKSIYFWIKKYIKITFKKILKRMLNYAKLQKKVSEKYSGLAMINNPIEIICN